MSKKTSLVHSDGRLVGKDSTRTYDDGCTKTVHQRAEYGSFGNVNATRITGVTTRTASGKVTYKKG